MDAKFFDVTVSVRSVVLRVAAFDEYGALGEAHRMLDMVNNKGGAVTLRKPQVEYAVEVDFE